MKNPQDKVSALRPVMMGGALLPAVVHGEVSSFVISIILFIISTVLTYLLTPKPKSQVPTAATLDEFQVPQADEGTPANIIFGIVWVKNPMVLWYGNLRNQPITKSTGGGKK